MHGPRRFTVFLLIALSLVVLVLSGCGVIRLTPQMSHQGRLLDASGNPVPDGDYEIVYRLFHVATGGTAVHTENRTVAVQDGLFTTDIGLSAAIDPTLFSRATWLEIEVDGETLTPRQRLQGAPYAFSLTSGSVVQGAETIDRDYAGQQDTGAALTVWNTDGTVTGGNGLLAVNQASPTESADREKTAALQARALGSTYGAIITSQSYRGLFVRSAPTWYDAYFMGDVGIFVNGNCTGCAMAYFAQNAGNVPIESGDFVAVVGVVADPDLNTPVMQVRKATAADDVVIGVSSSAATRDPVGEVNGVITGGFNLAEGPAPAGGYLSVVVQGLVQARAANNGVQPGAYLTAGTDGAEVSAADGFTRALSTVDGDGLVWVMLSGQ
ncbi:MAG: hypothetical protein R6X18_15790 [Chloroflexota bacterium]|jgi:hypothetical protein